MSARRLAAENQKSRESAHGRLSRLVEAMSSGDRDEFSRVAGEVIDESTGVGKEEDDSVSGQEGAA